THSCSYALSLHDALPIWACLPVLECLSRGNPCCQDESCCSFLCRDGICVSSQATDLALPDRAIPFACGTSLCDLQQVCFQGCSRSEEHTSELQSRFDIV